MTNLTQQQNPQSPNLTREYRARLTLSSQTTATITSGDRAELEDRIRALFQKSGNPVKFIDQDKGVSAIYHDSHAISQQPLGFLVEYQVPENMSVKNVTEHRMASQSTRAA